jgi:hypothetical protein
MRVKCVVVLVTALCAVRDCVLQQCSALRAVGYAAVSGDVPGQVQAVRAVCCTVTQCAVRPGSCVLLRSFALQVIICSS